MLASFSAFVFIFVDFCSFLSKAVLLAFAATAYRTLPVVVQFGDWTSELMTLMLAMCHVWFMA